MIIRSTYAEYEASRRAMTAPDVVAARRKRRLLWLLLPLALIVVGAVLYAGGLIP